MTKKKGLRNVVEILLGDLSEFEKGRPDLLDSQPQEDEIYNIITMKLYQVILVQLLQVAILVTTTVYLLCLDDINSSYYHRFCILNTHIINTLFLINLIIGLHNVPKISVNNHLYDNYYMTVFINPNSKNT